MTDEELKKQKEEEAKKKAEEKGSTLSYEILKKEHEELKKEFDAYKKETEAQIKDIKNVVLGNMKTNGQTITNPDEEKQKQKAERMAQFLKSLK